MEKTMGIHKRVSRSKKNAVRTDVRVFAKLKLDLRKNYDMYLLLIPGLVLLILFKYVPMYGITIAFQDFSIFKGISESD